MNNQIAKISDSLSVQIIERDEIKLIGLPVNVLFEGNKSAIGKTHKQFVQRKHEIKHAVQLDRYYSPFYACDLMFTYFYCLEVTDLADIPEGMIGFALPPRKYAAVHYDGPKPFSPDPYSIIHRYCKENGLELNKDAMPFEMYWFENDDMQNNRLILDVNLPLR